MRARHHQDQLERCPAAQSGPIVIGLTGNIGTGKSTVAEMLAEFGAHVIDADRLAHQVMRSGTDVHRQVVGAFGGAILSQDGEIDRKRLGDIVFADPKALAQLEAIVHPATIELTNRRIRTAHADIVVVEAIKLIESGMANDCDSVWVTVCRHDQQVHRIVDQRGLSPADAEQRMRAQPPQQEKIARADVVIDNSRSLSRTRAQVKAAWNRLTDGSAGQGPQAG